ncbi:MAG: hypothetical protein R3E97_03195 [Candidatus Eisenbacteria bacterium]
MRDKQGEQIGAVKAFEAEPTEFLFAPMLGNLKWKSEGEVVLTAKDGREVVAWKSVVS